MKDLEGKKILLGVSSSIAAYKIPELIRVLRGNGADVQIILTKNAEYLIAKKTLEVLSGNKVWTDMFDKQGPLSFPHLDLIKNINLFLIAPATANIIGKISNGIADDLLSTTFLACNAPIILCPSMNCNMWKNIIVSTNVRRLKRYGIKILGPGEGALACGDSGEGRLSDINSILEACIYELSKKDLKKKKILVTTGPTKEFFDPIRYISNESSGKTGYFMAKRAAIRGGQVELISGIKNLPQTQLFKIKKIKTGNQMLQSVLSQIHETDIFICTAAVSDFKPVTYSSEKIKKGGVGFHSDLELNVDILSEASREKTPDKIFVGFALETENLMENAHKKLIDKNLDFIVANKPQNMGADEGNFIILGRNNFYLEFNNISKELFADKLLDLIQENI